MDKEKSTSDAAQTATKNLTDALVDIVANATPEIQENAAEPDESQQEETSDPIPSETEENPEEPSETESEKPDLEALLAEAERKGYLKGRNERIEELMREPRMFQQLTEPKPSTPQAAESFLANMRPSIWDA